MEQAAIIRLVVEAQPRHLPAPVGDSAVQDTPSDALPARPAQLAKLGGLVLSFRGLDGQQQVVEQQVAPGGPGGEHDSAAALEAGATRASPAEQVLRVEWSGRLQVHEGLVRCLVAGGCCLGLDLQLLPGPEAEPFLAGSPKAGGKAAGGKAGAKGGKSDNVTVQPLAKGSLQLDCGALLAGDTSASACWPQAEMLLPLPPELAQHLASVSASLQVLTAPAEEPAPAAAGPGKAKGAAKPQKQAAAAAEAGAPADSAAGRPCTLLPPGLAQKLLPLVMRLQQATCLPDTPAPAFAIDQHCAPVRARLSWPALRALQLELQQLQQQQHCTAAEAAAAGSAAATASAASAAVQNAAPAPAKSSGKGKAPAVATSRPSSTRASKSTLPEAEGQLSAAALETMAAIAGPHDLPAAGVSHWRSSDGSSCLVRDAAFCRSLVLLLGDIPCSRARLLQLLREGPLLVEVRDRDLLQQGDGQGRPGGDQAAEAAAAAAASSPRSRGGKQSSAQAAPKRLPEVPAEPQQAAAEQSSNGAAREPAEEGYVCGVARLALHELVRGRRRAELSVPLLPLSTVRGAAGLDWSCRPGAYVQADAALEVQVAVPVPLAPPAGAAAPDALGAFSRAVFAMDYRDSDLFLTLEELVRKHNTRVLGLLKETDLMVRPHQAGAGSGQGAEAAEAAAATTSAAVMAAGGLAPKPVKHARFSSDDESHCGGEVPPSAAALRLEAALAPYGDICLGTRLLQALSTTQLGPQQAADPALDLLTGFHLTDGVERLLVLEGPAGGAAMQCVAEVQAFALAEPQLAVGWRMRKVLLNLGTRHASRLYAPLGVDLHILKLRAPLGVLLADPASLLPGSVRPECAEGLRRVAALREVQWARQADSCCLFPTTQQVLMLDKRFGGNLTDDDVLGVADEDEEDEEDEERRAQGQGQQAGNFIVGSSSSGKHLQPGSSGKQGAPGSSKDGTMPAVKAGAADASISSAPAGAGLPSLVQAPHVFRPLASLEMLSGSMAAAAGGAACASGQTSPRGVGSLRSSRLSSRARARSRQRAPSSRGSVRRKRYRTLTKPPVDMSNREYLLLREEARERRQARNLAHEVQQQLAELQSERAGVRAAWAAWNPQREAARQLEAAVREGRLTLEDTIRARQQAEPRGVRQPGEAPAGQLRQPFLWPAPRPAGQWSTCAAKPSEARCAELQQPYDEDLVRLAKGRMPLREDDLPPGQPGFRTSVRGPARGVFSPEPKYWRTVHLGGDGWEEELAARRRREKELWCSKLVGGSTVFHTLAAPPAKRPSQMDKVASLLRGPPLKPALATAHVPPPRTSMFVGCGWAPQPAAVQRDVSPAKWVAGPGRDFDLYRAGGRSAVARPGFSDSLSAALHDKLPAAPLSRRPPDLSG